MRSPRLLLAALFCSLSALLLIPASAAAQPGVYTYEGVADTRPASRFSDFGLPVSNDAGDVAFAARLKAGGSGIYKWSAATGVLVTIFEDPTNDWFNLHNSFSSPAIDSAGRVIFQYLHEAIHVGNGNGPPNVLVDDDVQHFSVPLGSLPGSFACGQPMLRGRSADSNGHVAISCSVSNGAGASGGGVYLANGGAPHRVCDMGIGFTNIFDRCFQDGPIEVSSAGVLAGIGAERGLNDQFGFPRQLLVRGTAAGLDVLLDPAVHTSALAFPNRLSRLGINAAGTVTYDAFQATAGGSGSAIFRIDVAGTPISVTDPRQFIYRDAVSPSINNVGEIPFVDTLRNGLFIGLDEIIIRSDEIPGYAIPNVITSVTTVGFQHPGINTLGDLTFVAFLADGTLVITRALRPNNHPPDVAIGDQRSPEGSPLLVHVTASDQDGDEPLVYSLVDPSPSPIPPGTIYGPPPGPLTIDQNGDITGTPAPGTAGNQYATRVTVADSRGLPTSVDFVWTITDPLPPPRVNLTARANVAEQGIDLAWQNPSPDTATRISLSISSTGPGGPFVEYQHFSPPATNFLLILPAGSGQYFCFVVNGIIDQPTMSLVSANSNIACATYPRFEILAPQPDPPTTTTTQAFFRATTSMPAALTVEGLPQGAFFQVNEVPQGDPRPTTFDILISNLPEAETPTDYVVTLMGESIPAHVLATRTVAFTTPGTGRGGGVQESNGPVLDARRTGPNQHRSGSFSSASADRERMEIGFDIFNEARATAAALPDGWRADFSRSG